MLNHENEHEKLSTKDWQVFLQATRKFELALHVSKFAFQGIYMFEFCPKKISNYTLSSPSATMFNTSRQKAINIKLIQNPNAPCI